MENLPAHIQDSTDVINKISELKDVPPNTLVATFDVENLYTNISHEHDITAPEFYLQNRLDDVKPPNTSICDLASSIAFRQGEYYLQVKGRSMGNSFCYLYVVFFEKQFI